MTAAGRAARAETNSVIFHQPLERVEKPGIRNRDRIGPIDAGGGLTRQGGNGEGHRHPVIPPGIGRTARAGASALVNEGRRPRERSA